MEKEEIGLYVHIPFCAKKCFYCDFISFENQEETIQQYIEVLKQEIQEKSKIAKEKQIDTIYIGGGTPSFIPANKIQEVLQVIRKEYKVNKDAEITIELNPGTINKDKLSIYHACGINRVSIGLQTTQNELLKTIGRIHTYELFKENYQLVKKQFTNINIDLMFGLPKQTKEMLEESVNQVIGLNPNHISVYSLIVEEGTILEQKIKNQELLLPSDDQERELYWLVKRKLENAGWNHYEISNFAKQGYESKHNWNCWNQKEYLGFGLASHSYFNKTRFSNQETFEDYQKQILEKEEPVIQEVQTKIMQMKEYMMLGLRKLEGVSILEFKKKFIQNPIYEFYKEFDKLVKQELIQIDTDRIQLTSKGLDLANLVWEEFI